MALLSSCLVLSKQVQELWLPVKLHNSSGCPPQMLLQQHTDIHRSYLVGGWATPLKNMSSSIGMMIPNILENKKWQPNHQPDIDIIWYYTDHNRSHIQPAFLSQISPFLATEIPHCCLIPSSPVPGPDPPFSAGGFDRSTRARNDELIAAELKTCPSWLINSHPGTWNSWHISEHKNVCCIGKVLARPLTELRLLASMRAYLHKFTYSFVIWVANVGKPSTHRWCECLILSGNHPFVFLCGKWIRSALIYRLAQDQTCETTMGHKLGYKVDHFIHLSLLKVVILFDWPSNRLDISLHPNPHVSIKH